MKNKMKKGLLYLAMGFFTLFTIRFIYGYFTYSNGLADSINNPVLVSDFEFSRKNYASAKLKFDGAIGTQSYSVDQKYEKIASLNSKTEEFSRDEKQVRELINKYNALIQFEQNAGLPGNRTLQLGIGVHPGKFDEMTAEIKNIGKLASINIDKLDKTNEYKDLQAKRVSLEKSREALISLKNKEGSIEDLVNLENRILEVEDLIQALGVKLGEYDQENEFCTIKFTLNEYQLQQSQIALNHRIKVALLWTVKYYFGAIFLLFISSLFVLTLIVILEKLKWIPMATAKYIEKHG
ncbi:MAG: DUF4349 domain-containing protein [Acidobacteriota bacterium]